IDNAPCHSHIEDILSEQEFLEHYILRLAPYSPMLNPIEKEWSVINSKVKRQLSIRMPQILVADRENISIMNFSNCYHIDNRYSVLNLAIITSVVMIIISIGKWYSPSQLLAHHDSDTDSITSWKCDEYFNKRECCRYEPNVKSLNQIPNFDTACICGKARNKHKDKHDLRQKRNYSWHPKHDTILEPTDAFGCIEYNDGIRQKKSNYVRMDYDTKAEKIVHFMQNVWNLDLPNAIISIHGGISEFSLNPRLVRVVNQGVVHYVSEVLKDNLHQVNSNVLTFGIAPWGVLSNKELLIGQNKRVRYFSKCIHPNDARLLNQNYSYYLLADDGTSGTYGAEIGLRMNLEKYITCQKITKHYEVGMISPIPVVCLLIEGGIRCIDIIVNYISSEPRIPVILIEDSNRAADLIAFVVGSGVDYCHVNSEFEIIIMQKIIETFQLTENHHEKIIIIYEQLLCCMKNRNLIKVYKFEEFEKMDVEILEECLRGVFIYIYATTSSPIEVINTILSWNRHDIARRYLFSKPHDWPREVLTNSMTVALLYNRTEFIKLFLEYGFAMEQWLDYHMIKKLYEFPVRSNLYIKLLKYYKKTRPRKNYIYDYHDTVNLVVDLLGNEYNQINKNCQHSDCTVDSPCKCTIHDLVIWAILTERHEIAFFLWEYGEENIARVNYDLEM
ncbi:hypothetical protein A3Q56_04687, partial [Intoshia linei]